MRSSSHWRSCRAAALPPRHPHGPRVPVFAVLILALIAYAVRVIRKRMKRVT